MITGSFHSTYGQVTVEIDIPFSTQTVEIVSMGAIGYEFDITPDSVNIDRLMAVYTRLDVKWLLNATDGTDLYDQLVAGAVLPIPVTVTIDGYDGTTSVFPFNLQSQDVSVDERTRTVKTSLGVAIDATLTVQDVWDNLFANYVSDLFIFRSGGTNYNAVSAKRWIQVALWMLKGGTGVITDSVEFFSVELAGRVGVPADFLTYTYDDIDVVDPALDAKFCLCCIDVAGVNKDALPVGDIPAITALQSMAGYEGGIFGFGFSTVFYVNRTVDYDTAVTVGYDQVLELSFTRAYKAFRNITIGTALIQFDNPNDHLPNFPTFDVTSATLNANAEKSVNLRFHPGYPVMQLGRIDSTVHLRVDSIAGTSADDANEGFLDASLDSYLPSFPATGNTTIECTLRGFGVVKPWELLSFDTTVPARYQGKTFRINAVSYDLKTDTTKIRAYEVG